MGMGVVRGRGKAGGRQDFGYSLSHQSPCCLPCCTGALACMPHALPFHHSLRYLPPPTYTFKHAYLTCLPLPFLSL